MNIRDITELMPEVLEALKASGQNVSLAQDLEAAIEADRERWGDLEAQLEEALTDRDDYHDMADQLAEQIAAITEQEIGEHSSGNSPWKNAVLAADEWMAKDIRRLTDGVDRKRRDEPVALSFGHKAIAAELLKCFEAWDPMVCVLGDVRARDGADLMRAILITAPQPTEPSRGEPVAYRAWDDHNSRWTFTLWPAESDIGPVWEPLYAAPTAPQPALDAADLALIADEPVKVQDVG